MDPLKFLLALKITSKPTTQTKILLLQILGLLYKKDFPNWPVGPIFPDWLLVELHLTLTLGPVPHNTEYTYM